MSYDLLMLLAASQYAIGLVMLAAACVTDRVHRRQFPGEAKTRRYSPMTRRLLIAGAWLLGIGALEFVAGCLFAVLTSRRE